MQDFISYSAAAACVRACVRAWHASVPFAYGTVFSVLGKLEGLRLSIDQLMNFLTSLDKSRKRGNEKIDGGTCQVTIEPWRSWGRGVVVGDVH